MKTALNTLKAWFETGDKPTQAQFWNWLDSFWHKDETIPQSAIEGLADDLGQLATTESLNDVAALIGAQTVTLNAPGSIPVGSYLLLEKIVVESASAQSITVETVVNAANLVDADTISAGGANVYQIDQYAGASGFFLYFRSFTSPITVKLYKR